MLDLTLTQHISVSPLILYIIGWRGTLESAFLVYGEEECWSGGGEWWSPTSQELGGGKAKATADGQARSPHLTLRTRVFLNLNF